MDAIYRNKGVPNEFLGQWRSIEFELVFKTEQSLNDFIKFAKEKDYVNYITIKQDGSLRAKNGDYAAIPREVIVSYKSGNEQIVIDVCSSLRDKAYVNKSCGTHVHFDMRNAAISRVNLYGKRLAYCVPALKLLLPKSRRNNQYCNTDINTIDDYNRYTFVNMTAYKKFKTIEIRGHSGTINSYKILNWIKLCERIMLHKISEKKLDSIEGLVEYYKPDEELKVYMLNRHNKVNAPKVKICKIDRDEEEQEELDQE